jgi:hypothetical protein
MRLRGEALPLRKTIQVNVGKDMPVTVQLSGKVAANLKAQLDATVSIQDKVSTHLAEIKLSAKDLVFEVK